MIMIVVVLQTKPSGLYRHWRGLGLHRVSYREGDLHIQIAKLAFHAKETPTRTRDEVFNLVSSQSNSPIETLLCMEGNLGNLDM